MLILLPPSEGKTAPESGPQLSMKSLSFPDLARTRELVLGDLVSLCSGNQARAATALGLGRTQLDLIAANADLKKAPTASAINVYTGVLYEALDFASLPATARKRADKRVAIASALFGLLRPSDPIPAYRLSGDTTLPRLGPLAKAWRDSIQSELSSTKGPILDLRSGAYVKLGQLPPDTAHRGFLGRVLLEKSGKRSVVSHHNKATKGHLVRSVLGATSVPTSAKDVPDFLHDLGFRAEVREPKKESEPLGLDIIVYET
jgi:cytoplasmic iron level regulating protein YaaA (DUF328/UPF0246 family)